MLIIHIATIRAPVDGPREALEAILTVQLVVVVVVVVTDSHVVPDGPVGVHAGFVVIALLGSWELVLEVSLDAVVSLTCTLGMVLGYRIGQGLAVVVAVGPAVVILVAVREGAPTAEGGEDDGGDGEDGDEMEHDDCRRA